MTPNNSPASLVTSHSIFGLAVEADDWLEAEPAARLWDIAVVSAARRQHGAARALRTALEGTGASEGWVADALGVHVETLRRKLRGDVWATPTDLEAWKQLRDFYGERRGTPDQASSTLRGRAAAPRAWLVEPGNFGRVQKPDWQSPDAEGSLRALGELKAAKEHHGLTYRMRGHFGKEPQARRDVESALPYNDWTFLRKLRGEVRASLVEVETWKLASKDLDQRHPEPAQPTGDSAQQRS